MRIFIVCNNLGGGGAERVAVNLANGLSRHGHEVWIITDIYQKASYPVDGKVVVLPLCNDTTSKLKWLGSIARIRRFARQNHPDVVIGFMHFCSIVARLAVIGLRIPVVMTIHHALESKVYHFNRLTLWLDKHTPRFYAATTVLNQADKDYLGDGHKSVYVMPNPLTFSILKEKVQKKKIILSAGRINNWVCKGFDLLIEAWGKIANQYPDWTLEIAGTGPQKDVEYLKSLAEANHVYERVQFLGYRTDMINLYREASIFALSSRSEGLPMVLIEAMSQGCAPVACENLGRTREIVQDDSQGLLFQTGDAGDLAKKLSKMLSNDSYRQQVQKAAIERSKFYELDNIVKKWESLLSQIV